MSTVAVSQPLPAGWLRSAGFDHFFITGIAAFALLSAAVVVARPELFQLILFADLWLLGYHHVIATFTRLAFDRESLREHRFFVFYLPFIVIGVVLAILYRGRDELPRLTARSTARRVFWLGMLGFILLTTSGDMMVEISWWDKTLQPLAIAATFGAITFGLLFGGDLGGLFGSAFLLFSREFRTASTSYTFHSSRLPRRWPGRTARRNQASHSSSRSSLHSRSRRHCCCIT